MTDGNKVPLPRVASTEYAFETQRIQRLEQFRTITVFSYPADGVLAAADTDNGKGYPGALETTRRFAAHAHCNITPVMAPNLDVLGGAADMMVDWVIDHQRD